jgi:hypothetical protein
VAPLLALQVFLTSGVANRNIFDMLVLVREGAVIVI